jgi:hypothetical protein
MIPVNILAPPSFHVIAVQRHTSRCAGQCLLKLCIPRGYLYHAILIHLKEERLPSLNDNEAKASGINAARLHHEARRRHGQGSCG